MDDLCGTPRIPFAAGKSDILLMSGAAVLGLPGRGGAADRTEMTFASTKVSGKEAIAQGAVRE